MILTAILTYGHAPTTILTLVWPPPRVQVLRGDVMLELVVMVHGNGGA